MKLTGVTSVYTAYQSSNSVSKQKNQTTETQKDTVAISSEARTFQMAMRALNNAPDVRSEIVDPLKARIDSGTYNVSNEDLADSMVDRFFSARQ